MDNRKRGEDHHASTMTADKVREIRALLAQADHPTQREIAKRYKTTPETIHYIKTRKSWAHVE